MDYKVKDLLQVLNTVKPAISTKDFSLSLKTIVFKQNCAYGYNGELYIETNFTSDLSGGIDFSILYKFLSTLSVDTINIEQTINNIIIKYGPSVITLPFIIPSESNLPQIPNRKKIILFSPDLKEKVKKAINFIGKDETQPMYRGILLSKEGIFATDGFKLFHDDYSTDTPDLLLTDNFCQLLLEYAPNEFYVTPTMLYFITSNTKVVTSRISNPFPKDNCLSLLETIKTSTVVVDINKQNIQDTLEKCAIITSELVDKPCNISILNELILQTETQLGRVVSTFNVIATAENHTLQVDLDILNSIMPYITSLEVLKIPEAYYLRGIVTDKSFVVLSTL